jgi:hypothetical protein
MLRLLRGDYFGILPKITKVNLDTRGGGANQGLENVLFN